MSEMTELQEKIKCLREWFSGYKRIALAFSGGVDSTFLLAAIKRLTALPVLAVTAAPPYVPEWEIEEAVHFTENLGVEHVRIPLKIPEVLWDNPPDRCYRCKSSLFTLILDRSREWEAEITVDGSNSDDQGDYRPGMRALKELGVRSPLLECGFTKADIRTVCREWGLSAADKPAYSCLLTRLPHGTPVRESDLRRIEQAERFLHGLGFTAVRVRSHSCIGMGHDGPYELLARIETASNKLEMMSKAETAARINEYLKRLGFDYVSFDAGGYRMGNMNRK